MSDKNIASIAKDLLFEGSKSKENATLHWNKVFAFYEINPDDVRNSNRNPINIRTNYLK